MSEDADNNISRRTLLKAVAVAAGVSLASTFTVTACSAKATKAAMEYQDKPQGDEQCSKCKFFIPGGDAESKRHVSGGARLDQSARLVHRLYRKIPARRVVDCCLYMCIPLLVQERLSNPDY
jgi:hypothetical protein